MCDFCKRYLNTLISGYVNIMSIFALQCRLNFKEGWMVAILTKINSIHSHLSFRVYICTIYMVCSCCVLMANVPWNTENWVEIRTAAMRFPTKKTIFCLTICQMWWISERNCIFPECMCSYFVVVARLMWIEYALDIYRLKPLKTLYSITNGNCTS